MALTPTGRPELIAPPAPRVEAPGEVLPWPESPLVAPSTRFNRPELDALRLAAFLMVWFSHSLPAEAELATHGVGARLTWWLLAIKDAGNFGVCVFFFLSAYLITELLRRELALTGTVALRAFYARRILRIWPLYLGVLAAYALLGLRFHGFRIEPGRLLASALLAGNWYIAFHPAILTPMRALWSISVEEQFYLAWPLLLKHAGRRAVLACAWAVFAVALAVTAALALTQPAQWLHVTAWVNSFVQFQYFALGALAAMLLRGSLPRLRAVARFACAASAALLALMAAGVCQIKRAPVSTNPVALPTGYLLVGCACVLLFFGVFGLRWTPPVTIQLGRVSFGLYVFHETGFFIADEMWKHILSLAAFQREHWAWALAANKLLALALTFPLALASYRFWEKPFLRWKDHFTVVRSRCA